MAETDCCAGPEAGTSPQYELSGAGLPSDTATLFSGPTEPDAMADESETDDEATESSENGDEEKSCRERV